MVRIAAVATLLAAVALVIVVRGHGARAQHAVAAVETTEPIYRSAPQGAAPARSAPLPVFQRPATAPPGPAETPRLDPSAVKNQVVAEVRSSGKGASTASDEARTIIGELAQKAELSQVSFVADPDCYAAGCIARFNAP